MIGFNEWLIMESQMSLTTSPGLEKYVDKAKNALIQYLNRYRGLERPAALGRFSYHLDQVRDAYGELIFRYNVIPRENRRGGDEMASPDDHLYDYYKKFSQGKTGARMYPSPKDALASIPDNPALGWRGMSWEEWKASKRRGYIQSMGEHNFDTQRDLTFYGSDPETAMSYAGSFAPTAFSATPKRPGIVIGVPRGHLMDRTQNPAIPGSELAHKGPLPLDHVAEIYMLVAVSGRAGTLELIVYKTGKVGEGSRSDARLSYVVRRIS